MAHPSTVIVQLAAAAATGVAASQAVAGAGNLTINGTLASGGVATLDTPRRIIIASSGADGALVFTVTGTDRYGVTTSETITGVATPTPVQSQRDYKTITQIAVSAAAAGNISAGTNTVGSSEWVMNNLDVGSWALAGGITGPAGTTYTLEYTFDDPDKIGTSLVAAPEQPWLNPRSFVPPHAFVAPAFSTPLSGDNQFTLNPCQAHRVTVNTGTGQVVMQSAQSGISSR